MATPAAPPPHRPPDDNEEVYFEGSPSLMGNLGPLIVAGLVELGLIAAAVVLSFTTGGLALLIGIPVAMLVGTGMMAYLLLKNRSQRFRVTNYRIDYERGLLSKSIDTLELWHVEDISFHQTLLNRITNTGNITVLSHDDTMPTLQLQGIPNARELFDVLKQRIISVKRQRGVLKLDSGN